MVGLYVVVLRVVLGLGVVVVLISTKGLDGTG